MATCVLPVLQTCDSGRDSVTTALHPVLSPSPSSSSRMSSLWLVMVMVMVWSVVLLSCPTTSSALPSVRSQLTAVPREKPTFLEMPNDVIATESDTVELRCRATGDPQPSFRWLKLDGAIPAGRTQQLADGTLRVERVQGSDDGLYECVVENILGEVKAVARISVQIGPSFQVLPSNKEVERGGTATLQCVVTGNPPPTVVWTKEGERGGTATLQCVVTGNPLPTVVWTKEGERGGTATLQCVVTGNPPPTVVWTKEGERGGTATLQCVVTGNPLPTVVWTKEGERGGTATLQCVVTGNPPPTVVWTKEGERGGTATLQCVVTGNPLPTVVWTKEGEQHLMFPGQVRGRHSVSAHGTLRISDVRDHDAGGYLCQGINVLGAVTASATISVR